MMENVANEPFPVEFNPFRAFGGAPRRPCRNCTVPLSMFLLDVQRIDNERTRVMTSNRH